MLCPSHPRPGLTNSSCRQGLAYTNSSENENCEHKKMCSVSREVVMFACKERPTTKLKEVRTKNCNSSASQARRLYVGISNVWCITGPSAVQKGIDLSSSNSKIILPGSFLRGYYIRTLHSTRVEPSPKRGSWIATSFVRWCQCRSSTSHKTCRNDNHDKKYSSNLRYCCCRCCCGHQ